MAGKFVDLKEAAKMIGVTAEELVDMRSRGDIFGYRDGAMIRTQLAFDADAARALAHTWLQALRTYGSLAVFMTSSR